MQYTIVNGVAALFWNSWAKFFGSGMSPPGSGSEHGSTPDPDPHISLGNQVLVG
jgi:hypothetical protein